MGSAVRVGAVTGEFSGGSLFDAYITLSVEIGGRTIKVATMIGVRESDRDTCRKAFGDVRPFLSTWWADASDFQDVARSSVDDVEAAIADARPRLWRATLARRAVRK